MSDALSKTLERAATKSFTADTKGHRFFAEFQNAIENVAGEVSEPDGLSPSDWPNEEEITTVMRFKSNKLTKQRHKKAIAKHICKGSSRDAPPKLQFKYTMINALRVAFGSDGVLRAIDEKVPGCERSDEIFGTNLADVWGERHARLEDTPFDYDKQLLLKAVLERNLPAVDDILGGWEPLDVE